MAVLSLCLGSAVVSAADEEIVALTDNFADGNTHTGPAWVAGDLHWFNPYFVESIDGKPWATARRYGSMGTWFTLPPERIWSVALDPRRGLLRFALTVRFKPGTGNNVLHAAVLGTPDNGRIDLRFLPDGAIAVTVGPASRKGGVHLHCPVPRLLDGVPVRFEFGFGGDAGFVLQRDGKPIFSLKDEQKDALRREFGAYSRLAFIGSQQVTDSNPYVMSPSFKDALGYCWISDIEVRGIPEQIEMPQGLTLHAAPRSLLALRGVGGFDTTVFADLAAAGWTVTQVLDQATKPSQNPLQSHLTLANLLTFQSVVLVDIPAPRLGLAACAALNEYVRLGGCVLIFGGGNTLNRGRYFTSPLGECLPVTGGDGLDALTRNTAAANHEYAYEVNAKPGSTTLPGSPLLIRGTVGQGRVIVSPWTTLGNPPEPFWRSPAFAKAVAGAIEAQR